MYEERSGGVRPKVVMNGWIAVYVVQVENMDAWGNWKQLDIYSWGHYFWVIWMQSILYLVWSYGSKILVLSKPGVIGVWERARINWREKVGKWSEFKVNI